MSLYLGETPICGGIEGNQLNNPFSLLDYKFSEYEINNASWLRSNGQYNSGTTYVDVYNLLLQIKNGTITKAGVSVKLSTETYEDTDFVLNTSDTTFRLPLKVALASGKAVAGNGMTLGLTNGTNNYGLVSRNATSANGVYGGYTGSYGKNIGLAGDSGSVPRAIITQGITTDPTKSGIETSANGLYLYFYVGETVQDANLINAGQVLNDVANLKAHYIVETYVNGTSWYRVYSDGWCEQGFCYSPPSSSSQTINLLKEYKDTNYIVQTTYNTGSDWGNPLYVYNKTVNNFILTTKSTWNTSTVIAISVCGYIN